MKDRILLWIGRHTPAAIILVVLVAVVGAIAGSLLTPSPPAIEPPATGPYYRLTYETADIQHCTVIEVIGDEEAVCLTASHVIDSTGFAIQRTLDCGSDPCNADGDTCGPVWAVVGGKMKEVCKCQSLPPSGCHNE